MPLASFFREEIRPGALGLLTRPDPQIGVDLTKGIVRLIKTREAQRAEILLAARRFVVVVVGLRSLCWKRRKAHLKSSAKTSARPFAAGGSSGIPFVPAEIPPLL